MSKILEKIVPPIGNAVSERNPLGAGRKKGKNRKPVKPTDAHAEKFIAKRAKTVHKAIQSVKLKDDDYKYLKNSFDVLISSYDMKNIPKTYPEKKGRGPNPRYTPRQMFDNAKKYVEATINAAQPLTITGMGLFMGMRRKHIFTMLSDTKAMQEPEYSFIFDFCDFIEMYNEYAAHKKQNPAGPIFILKNFGWADKFEIEASSTQGALTDLEREAAQKRISQFSE